MSRTYDSISIADRPPSVSPAGALLLLLLTYGSVLLAPRVMPFVRSLQPEQIDWRDDSSWGLILAVSALAIGLLIALMMALGRMLRDMRSQPYAALGPTLGALIGVELIMLRAPLAIAGVQSTVVAVSCLSASILGSALTQRGGAGTALLGALLTATPTAVVGFWLRSTGVTGTEQLPAAIAALDVTSRSFVLLLGSSGVLLAVMALLSRTLAPSRFSLDEWDSPSWSPARKPLFQESLRWSDGTSSALRTAALRVTGAAHRYANEAFQTAHTAPVRAARRLKTLWNTKAGEAPPIGFNVWNYHDDANPEVDDAALFASVQRGWLRGRRLLTVVAVLMAVAVALSIWAFRH